MSPLRRSHRKPPRWVPNQHGAWAMLLVPFLVGVMARLRSGEPAWFLAPLLVCWLAGYVAFFTASGWLKAPPARRGPWVRPFLIAAAVTGVGGLAAMALTGPLLAAWLPVFVLLLTPALWLAHRRREREWTGGALTVAAASAMILVARYPDPTQLPGSPDLTRTLLDTGVVFAYFFGTVLYVKTNIRERGNQRFFIASVCWHLTATLASAALAWTGTVSWWWTLFFAATLVRAVLVPRRNPPLTPRTIGLTEGVFSLALILGTVWF